MKRLEQISAAVDVFLENISGEELRRYLDDIEDYPNSPDALEYIDRMIKELDAETVTIQTQITYEPPKHKAEASFFRYADFNAVRVSQDETGFNEPTPSALKQAA